MAKKKKKSKRPTPKKKARKSTATGKSKTAKPRDSSVWTSGSGWTPGAVQEVIGMLASIASSLGTIDEQFAEFLSRFNVEEAEIDDEVEEDGEEAEADEEEAKRESLDELAEKEAEEEAERDHL